MFLENLNVDPARLTNLCKWYNVARLEVFGSFTHGDATEKSDLDVLATFNPGVQIGLKSSHFSRNMPSLFSADTLLTGLAQLVAE